MGYAFYVPVIDERSSKNIKMWTRWYEGIVNWGLGVYWYRRFYKRMKSLWLTNKLDGSEDHLVSEKICTIVGEGFFVKQNNLMQNTSLTSLQ